MADGRFDSENVSQEWDEVLSAARKAGVKFYLTSGRRSMSEQLALYRLYRSGRGNLAAFPSPNAPHIRVGRIDHAIDVNSLDGGETRLERWLELRGARPSNPVRGESWHMELSASDLRRLAARLDDDDDDTPALRKGMKPNRVAVRRLQKWLRALDVKVPLNGRYDLRTRAGVKRWQRAHGIPTDSNATVGETTWRKLKEAVR